MSKTYYEIENLITRYPKLKSCKNDILQAFYSIDLCYKNGGKLLVAGNGGSAADALHIVGELMKAFVLPRMLSKEVQDALYESSSNAEYLQKNLQMALPAIALVSEVGLTTAYSNDVASDLIFAQQVLGYAKVGDVFLGISTSGNSKNIIYAAEVAKAMGMRVIGLTGENGGKMKGVSDVCIKVPEKETFKVQELHLPVYHAICLEVEKSIFG